MNKHQANLEAALTSAQVSFEIVKLQGQDAGQVYFKTAAGYDIWFTVDRHTGASDYWTVWAANNTSCSTWELSETADLVSGLSKMVAA